MRIPVSAMVVITLSASLRAGGAVPRQDAGLSGEWTREAEAPAEGSGNSAGFGPRVTITQTGTDVTVQPTGGAPIRVRADGREVSTVVSDAACAKQTRITRAVPGPREVRISTWLVRQNGCGHGETDLFQPGDPEESAVSPAAVGGAVRSVAPTRRLEGVVVIFRQGDRLIVETTRPLPNGGSQTTSTTYHR